MNVVTQATVEKKRSLTPPEEKPKVPVFPTGDGDLEVKTIPSPLSPKFSDDGDLQVRKTKSVPCCNWNDNHL